DLFVRRVRRVQELPEQPRTTQESPPVENQPPPAIFQPGAPGMPEVTGVRLPTPGSVAPVSETVPQPPSPPPTPMLLNRALQLQDSQVRVYGWIENSINLDTNGLPRNRENFSIYSDHLADQWMGNQYYLVLENALEQDDKVNFGFRFDLLF